MTNREESGRGQVGLRRKALLLFSLLVFVALVVGSVVGDRGLLHVMEQERRARDLEEQLAALRDENARLAVEIKALRTDPRAVERLAREQLGLARPGETVFLLRAESTSAGR